MAEFSITQSLFGLNPQAIQDAQRIAQAKEDDAYALRVAELDSGQRDVYWAARGGRQLGRNVGELVGGMMGVNTAPRSVQLAQTTQGIMRELANSGFNPNDTVGIRKELARRLAAAGFAAEATMLAQEVAAQEQEAQKTSAEIAFKGGQTLKNIAEAKNMQSPFDKVVATGKYTPDSMARYQITQDPSDLELHDPDRYMTVETSEGVFLVNKANPNDRLRIGDIKPTANSQHAALKSEWKAGLKSVWERFGSDNAEPDVVIDRFKRADPQGYANLMAVGKEAVGADNIMEAFGMGKPLQENQSKLLFYWNGAKLGKEIFDKKGWGSKRALPNVQGDWLVNLQNEATKDPDTKITLQMILNKIGDKDTREYLSDAFGMLLPTLRQHTGAAIAKSEWVNYFNTFIPSGNANDTDNESRLLRMQNEVDGMQAIIEKDHNLARVARGIDKIRTERAAKEKTKPTSADTDLLREAKEAKAAGKQREWFLSLPPDKQRRIRELATK